MPRALRRLLVALAALAGVVLVVVIAWGIDLRAHDGEVVRNTELAGRDIGGMTRAQVARVVTDVASEFEAADITVRAGGEGFTTDASTLGVAVDETATLGATFDVGRDGTVVGRLGGWMRSLVRPREVTLRVGVDEPAVYRTVREEDPGPREEPVEPHIVLKEGRLNAAEGETGRGIDAGDVIEALPDAAANGEPFVVEVERGDVEPRWTTDHVDALIRQARELIDEPLPVKAGSTEARVPAATARAWLRSRADDDGLHLTVDPDSALADLSELLAAAGTPATETKFTVDGGAVRIIAGEAGTRCCAEDAVALVERALLEEGDPGATQASSTTSFRLNGRSARATRRKPTWRRSWPRRGRAGRLLR